MPEPDPHAALAAALDGAEVPPGVRELPGDVLTDLAVLIDDARRMQQRELATAAEGGLRHVPGLLRGPLKKVLGL